MLEACGSARRSGCVVNAPRLVAQERAGATFFDGKRAERPDDVTANQEAA
jgi:hypothetical protein